MDQIAAAVRRLLSLVPPNAATLMLGSRRVGLDPDLYLEAYFVTQRHFAGLEAALDGCPNGRHLLAFTHDGFGAAAVSTRPLRRCITLTAEEYSSRAAFIAALDRVKGAEMIAVFVHGGPSSMALINEIKAALQQLDSDAKRAVVIVCDSVSSGGREYPTVHTATWELLYLDTVAAPAQQIQHAVARHLGNAAAAGPGGGQASITSLLRHAVERFRPPHDVPDFLSGDVRRFYEQGTSCGARMRILENALRPAMVETLHRGAGQAQETPAVLQCAQKVAQSEHPLPFSPALEAEMQSLTLASAERVLRVATDDFALESLVKYNHAAEGARNAILSLACTHGALRTHTTPTSAPRCPLNPWLLWAIRASAAAHLPRPREALPDYAARLVRSDAVKAIDAAVDQKDLFAEAAHDAVASLLDTRRVKVAPELIAQQCARLGDSLAGCGAGEGWLHTTLHIVLATAHYSSIADAMADRLRLATLGISAGSGSDAVNRLAASARDALGTAPKQQVPGILAKMAAVLPWAELPDGGAVIPFTDVVRCLVGDDTMLGSLAAAAPVLDSAWAECHSVVQDTAAARPGDKERLVRALVVHTVLQPGFDAEPLLLATLELPRPSSVRLARLVLYAVVASSNQNLSDVLSTLCSAADSVLRVCEVPPMAGPVWSTADSSLPDELTLESDCLPAPAAALLLVLVEKLRHAGDQFSNAARGLQEAVLVRWSPATKQVCEAALFHAWAWCIAAAESVDGVPVIDAFANEARRPESPWRPLIAAAVFRMPVAARPAAAQALLDSPLEARPWPTAATHPALYNDQDPEHDALTTVQRLLTGGTVADVVGAVGAIADNRKGPLLVAAVVDTTLRGDLADTFQDRAAVAELSKAVVAEEHPDHALWTALLSLAAGIGADILVAASHAADVLPGFECLRSNSAVWSHLLTFAAHCLSADPSTNHYATYLREPSRAKRRDAFAFGDMFSVPIIHGLDCSATVVEYKPEGPRFQYGIRPPWLTDGRAVSLAMYYTYLALVGHVLLFPALADRCHETAVTGTGQASAMPPAEYAAKTVAGRVATFVAAKVLEIRALHDVYAWRDDFDAVFHRLAPAAVASTPTDRDVYASIAERAAAETRFMQEFVLALPGAVAHRRVLEQALGNVSEWTTNAARDAPRLLADAPASPLAADAPGAPVITAALAPEVQRAVALLPHIPPLARLHLLLQREHGPGAPGTLADIPRRVAVAALQAQNSIVDICDGQARFECNPDQRVEKWGDLDSVSIASCLEPEGCLAFTAAIDSVANAAKLFAGANVTLPEGREAKAVLAAAAPLVLVPRGAGLMAPAVAHMASVLPLVAGITDATDVTAAVLQVSVAVPLLVIHDGLPGIDVLRCSCDRRERNPGAPLTDEKKVDLLQDAAHSVAGAPQPALPHAFFAAAQPLRGDAAAAAAILRDAAAGALVQGVQQAHDMTLAELLPATVEGNEARTRHLLAFLPECWKVPHAKAVFDVLVSISEASGDVALQRGRELFPPQFHEDLPVGLDIARTLTETAQATQTTEAITEMCDHLGLAADYLVAGVAGAGDILLADFVGFCQDDLWPPLARLLGVADDSGLRTTHALRLWATFTATISTLQLRRFQDVGARWVELEAEEGDSDHHSESGSTTAETETVSTLSLPPSEGDFGSDEEPIDQEPSVPGVDAVHIGDAVLRLAEMFKARKAAAPSLTTIPHHLTACPADVHQVPAVEVAEMLIGADDADGHTLDEQSRTLLELTAERRPVPRNPKHAVFTVPQEIPPANFVCTKAELEALQTRKSCSQRILGSLGLSSGRALVLPSMVGRDLRRVPCATIAIIRDGDDGPPVVTRRLRYWSQGRWREEQREAFALSPVSLVVRPGAGRGVPCNLATGVPLQGDCTWRDVPQCGVQVHDNAVTLSVRNAFGEQLGEELVVGSSTLVADAAQSLLSSRLGVFEDGTVVSALIAEGASTDHVLHPPPDAVEVELHGTRCRAATVSELLRDRPPTSEVWRAGERLAPGAVLQAGVEYELRRRFKVTAHLTTPAGTVTRSVAILFDPAHPVPVATVRDRVCAAFRVAAQHQPDFVLFDRITYRVLEVLEPTTRSLLLAPRTEIRRVVLRSCDDRTHSIGEFHSDASCESVSACLRPGVPSTPDSVLCVRLGHRSAPYVALESGGRWLDGRGPLLGLLPGHSFDNEDESASVDDTEEDVPSTCGSTSEAEPGFWGGEEEAGPDDDSSLRSEDVDDDNAATPSSSMQWPSDPDDSGVDEEPANSVPADAIDTEVDAHVSLRIFFPAHLFTVSVAVEGQPPETVRMWNRGANRVTGDVRSWVLPLRGATSLAISTASLHAAVLSEGYGLTTPGAAPVCVSFVLASGKFVCATEVLAGAAENPKNIAVAAANRLAIPTASIRSGCWRVEETDVGIRVVRPVPFV